MTDLARIESLLAEIDNKQDEWNRRHLKALAWGLLLSLPFWLGVARMWGWL